MVIGSTDLSDEDVIAAVESALSAELNVHPSDLEVSFDKASGLVIFVVTGDDMESLIVTVTTIRDEDFISNLNLEEDLSIDSIEIADDIVVTVDVVVDASNKIVTPGVIAPDTQIGILEIGAISETRDGDSNMYSMGFSVFDAINHVPP